MHPGIEDLHIAEAGGPAARIASGLARGGILDDRAHTSNSPDYLLATGYAGAPLYRAAEAAVTDRDVITASAMAPLEFAHHIFRRLQLYGEPVLEAWYGLFRTRDVKYFLMEKILQWGRETDEYRYEPET